MHDAAKKSVMMNLVRHRPMMGPSIFLPTRDRGGVQLHWLTAYGQQITGSKPHGAERVELKAYSLAGYIPWYDEFEEDIFIRAEGFNTPPFRAFKKVLNPDRNTL